MTAAPLTETTESVEKFAARARAWLAENMPSIDPSNPPELDRREEKPWLRARELQKKLYEGGFAGICFRASTAAWACPSRIRRCSTTNPVATSCRSS